MVRRNKSGPAILVFRYSCFDRLIALLKGSGYQVFHGLEASTVNEKDRAAAAGDLRSRHSLVRDAWRQIKTDSRYQRRFEFLGMSCFGFFDRLFSELIDVTFLDTLILWERLKAFYEHVGIRAVIVPFDEPNFPRLCVRAAQLAEIPTVVVQHGAFSYESGHRELMTADMACVISDHDRQQMMLRRPGADVRVVGCLQLDQYRSRHEPREPLVAGGDSAESGAAGRVTRALQILVLTNTPHSFTVRSKSTDPDLYLAGIVAALDAARERLAGTVGANFGVTFKLHPAEGQERYQTALDQLGPSFSYTIATGWRLPKMLHRFDLVISLPSTAIWEAVVLGKPAIHFCTVSESVPRAFEPNSGLPTATQSTELADLMVSAARDYPRFLARYDFRAATRYLGPTDGHAAERLEEVVRQMVNAAPGGGNPPTSFRKRGK